MVGLELRSGLRVRVRGRVRVSSDDLSEVGVNGRFRVKVRFKG